MNIPARSSWLLAATSPRVASCAIASLGSLSLRLNTAKMSGRAARKSKNEEEESLPDQKADDTESKGKGRKKRAKREDEGDEIQAAPVQKRNSKKEKSADPDEATGPRKWLLKSEPDEYSIDLLRSRPDSTGFWDVSYILHCSRRLKRTHYSLQPKLQFCRVSATSAQEITFSV